MIKLTGAETGRKYYINPKLIAAFADYDYEDESYCIVGMDDRAGMPKYYKVKESAEIIIDIIEEHES